MFPKQVIWLLILSALISSFQVTAWSQSPPKRSEQASNKNNNETEAPVQLGDDYIFSLYYGLGPFSAKERSEHIKKILEDLCQNPFFDPEQIKVQPAADGADIVAGTTIITRITSADGTKAGDTAIHLAGDYAERLKYILKRHLKEVSLSNILTGIGYCFLATIILAALLIQFIKASTRLLAYVENILQKKQPALRIQNAELISARNVAAATQLLMSSLQIGGILLIFYGYVFTVLYFFPGTRSYANTLLQSSLAPLMSLGFSTAGYLPNLFSLVVISLVTYAAISFTRFIFESIAEGNITVSGFDQDWSEPTYKIVRFLIIAFALVAALPHIPGWQSESFKQVGLFLGVLLSLGSTGAVGHVIAGVVLTYTRAFKVGDVIKVGEHTGKITQKTLFATQIQTFKNEEVTVHNGEMLNSRIVNYSTLARQEGLVIHTTVTMGYDTSWRTIHQLLIDSALACEYIAREPMPFVLQTALDDFYAVYELNAVTAAPELLPRIYSELHQNIQDKFNEAGVEIMSAHYSYLRDGNRTTIPESYLPKEYKAPKFTIETTGL